MIRTEVVTLSCIPASAYKQKLPSGGAGIVIIRGDCAQPGLASISKTSGKAIPAKNNPASFYPAEAFDEAIALTSGLPYKKRGAPAAAPVPAEEPEEAQAALEVVVDSAEYQKIVDAYSDKSGKLSYALLNKDLIKFAHSSSIVRDMLAKKASVEKIRLYITGAKYRSITGNRKLTDDQVLKISELLDDVSPKGVFKDLNDSLRKSLKK